mgnify:CR=1 FL=1
MRQIIFVFISILIISFPTKIFAQANPSVLMGQIVDEFGTPLYGANIIFVDLNQGTSANSNGDYILKGNFEGSHRVEYSYVGFKSITKTISFKKGETQTLNIILNEDPSALDEISLESKSKVRLKREEAYAINVIKAEELYNTGANINDVLNRTSGVRVRENGGLGSDFTFSLNGFSGRQVKFFLDGIPIDNFGSSLTLNNFPVNLADRIEVYKGVLPINLGSDALGGAVNIVTRTNPNYLDASYGYGSFNTHRANLNFAYTNPENGFTARAITFYNYSDNNYKVNVRPIDLETGQRMEEQEVERFHDKYASATANIEVGVTGKSYADKLLIGFIASGNEKDIQTGVTMDQVFGARTANSRAFIPTLKYSKKNIGTDGLDLSFYGAYNNVRNQFIDTTRVRYNWLQETKPTTSAELNRTQLENKDREALVTTNLGYKINNQHGVSLNYLATDFNRESSDVEDPNNITFLFPQKLSKQILGFAYQAKYERFTGTAFAKAYFLKAESFESITNNMGETNFQQTNTNANNFGYGSAATYFIMPKLQAKISYEYTYRLPEASELLGDGLYTRRNSKLTPETSDNINVGAKYEFNMNSNNILAIDANYLFRKSKDFIRLDQSQSQPVDRQYVNLGDVTTNGVELALNYSYKNRLNAGANFTYQSLIDKQEFLTSTNFQGTTTSPNLNFGFRIPNIPYLYGNFNLDYTFPKKNIEVKNQLNIGYSLNYVQEYFLTPNQLGSNNQDNIPTQLSHNLGASYELLNGKFNISLELKNISNEDLYDNYLLQKPGRSFFINLRYFLDKSIF